VNALTLAPIPDLALEGLLVRDRGKARAVPAVSRRIRFRRMLFKNKQFRKCQVRAAANEYVKRLSLLSYDPVRIATKPLFAMTVAVSPRTDIRVG